MALIALLRAWCARFGDGGGSDASGARPGDAWDAGYRAGRRAGRRPADDAAPRARAPYPGGSPAAAAWYQGFRIGFCDGAQERA